MLVCMSFLIDLSISPAAGACLWMRTFSPWADWALGQPGNASAVSVTSERGRGEGCSAGCRPPHLDRGVHLHIESARVGAPPPWTHGCSRTGSLGSFRLPSWPLLISSWVFTGLFISCHSGPTCHTHPPQTHLIVGFNLSLSLSLSLYPPYPFPPLSPSILPFSLSLPIPPLRLLLLLLPSFSPSLPKHLILGFLIEQFNENQDLSFHNVMNLAHFCDKGTDQPPPWLLHQSPIGNLSPWNLEQFCSFMCSKHLLNAFCGPSAVPSDFF